MSIAAIIADDFSSATDCGVQFALHGMDTVALIDIPGEGGGPPCEVLSIDTDSRNVSPVMAYERVSAAVRSVKLCGNKYIYKSIDSTIRGNLGAEIDAVMDVFGREFALITPAFPFYGRTTINGIHYLDGTPISETAFSTDPMWPASESDLAKRLGQQTARPVGCVGLTTLRAGTKETGAAIAEMGRDGKSLIIFDVETEDDLWRVAQVTAAMADKSVTVGSTGLSRYLPAAWGLERAFTPEAFEAPGDARVVLVACSASPVTHAQVERYLAAGPVQVNIDTRAIVLGKWSGVRVAAERKILDAVAGGLDIAITTTSSAQDVEDTQRMAEARGLDRVQVAEKIAGEIAALVTEVVGRTRVHALILTGGDTAKAVARSLGATGVRLIREIEPGIPAGRFTGRNPVLIVTKAGAFGSPQSLVVARDMLRGASR